MSREPTNDQYNPSAATQHGDYLPPYSGGSHLSYHILYGPSVPDEPPSTGNGTKTRAGLAVPLFVSNTVEEKAKSEEISTIFVFGFPGDMQEREFQNMFTFSTGFEAATLKIMNKKKGYTSSCGVTGLRSISNAFGYGGPSDPYNLTIGHQGGVVDSGRDGMIVSWPATVLGDEVAGSQFPCGGLGGDGAAINLPRKQMIGFAKFRTREDALRARDVLQGRRVDIDKGVVLKAEMAKKNLHARRGVFCGATAVAASRIGGGGGANQGGMQQTFGTNAIELGMSTPDPYSFPGNSKHAISRERESETSGAAGLGSGNLNPWKDQVQQL